MDARNIVIVLLAVGVAVLGYLYYYESQQTVRIDVPGVKIEAR